MKLSFLWKSGAFIAFIFLVLFLPKLLSYGATPTHTATSDFTVCEAIYPSMIPYPVEIDFSTETGEIDYKSYNKAFAEWLEGTETQYTELGKIDWNNELLENFFVKTAPQFLQSAGAENKIYSPVSIYITLGMLSEVCDGESREQIFNLLGVEDINALRAQISALWNANYCKDGLSESVLANSIWLNQNTKINKKAMDLLARYYYTSSYQGEMGSDEFNKILRSWIKEQTHGQFDEMQAFSPETLFAFVSTAYFNSEWVNCFKTSENTTEVFFTPTDNISCEFMHTSRNMEYYWGNTYAAIALRLKNDGYVWLILPDNGASLNDVLNDKDIYEMCVLNKGHQETVKLSLSMPKFDVSSNLDLIDSLKALGVKDIFNRDKSNFTPMTDASNLYISKAEHTSRVVLDERGCTAASYTIITVYGEGREPCREVDFVLDRPFMFVVTSKSHTPIYAGIVNQPRTLGETLGDGFVS